MSLACQGTSHQTGRCKSWLPSSGPHEWLALAPALLQEQLLEEMSGVKDKMERRLKREKRRRKEQKTKARIRAAQMAQSEWEL